MLSQWASQCRPQCKQQRIRGAGDAQSLCVRETSSYKKEVDPQQYNWYRRWLFCSPFHCGVSAAATPKYGGFILSKTAQRSISTSEEQCGQRQNEGTSAGTC